MSTQDILAELPLLPVEDLERIARALHDLKDEKQADPCPTLTEPRCANLHPGAMIMSADFDDPLPDEFWFGKDK